MELKELGGGIAGGVVGYVASGAGVTAVLVSDLQGRRVPGWLPYAGVAAIGISVAYFSSSKTVKYFGGGLVVGAIANALYALTTPIGRALVEG